MKIIEPSATIIEPELAGLSVCQRIDRCASVCYQRPPRPTEEEAERFCRHLIERGHLPALEMATIHLTMPFWESLDWREEKYLHVHHNRNSPVGIVSGSIRAWMETDYGSLARNLLASEYPLFFAASDQQRGFVRFATPDEIPWQHKHVAVRVICSRAISHQLVRHRPCAFLQESARFCKYDDGVTFIWPEWAEEFDDYQTWAIKDEMFKWQCHQSEAMYRLRRGAGLSPQQARGALIHDVKTELIIYASLPEWRHIFKMRCGAGADPEIRRIMVPLREQFLAEYPEMWEDE